VRDAGAVVDALAGTHLDVAAAAAGVPLAEGHAVQAREEGGVVSCSRGSAAAARDDAAFIRRLDGMAFGERQSGRRIRVVQVRPGERIADLARVSNLERHAEAQLRLLNGLYPGGEPRPGQWIKIVQ